MTDLVMRSKSSGYLAPREVINHIERLAPNAVETLEELMKNSKADSVRLKAAVHILELGGVTKETRLTVKADVSDISETDLDERLAQLMGTAAATYIEGSYEDITGDDDEEDEEEYGEEAA
jgi:hypothetical protein